MEAAKEAWEKEFEPDSFLFDHVEQTSDDNNLPVSINDLTLVEAFNGK